MLYYEKVFPFYIVRQEVFPLKYWRGYITAAIFAVVTLGLREFAKTHQTLVDMVYPYISRLIQTYLAGWCSGVDFCLWQVIAVLLVVLLLASVVVMIVLRWNFFQWLGWVLASASLLIMLHTGIYGLNSFAGPLSEDIHLNETDYTVTELAEATKYYLDEANKLSTLVQRDADGNPVFPSFEAMAAAAGDGFKTLTMEESLSVFAGSLLPVKKLGWSEMYTSMDKASHNPIIDRAIPMHNLIRLITLTLAGDGWLNFMGNEFGHPEWIDFPREGNGWSYKYARRQWSLADNGFLKYEWLNNFDREMLKFAKKYRVLASRAAKKLWDDFDQKLLVFAKGDTILAFNLDPSRSQADFFIPVGAVGAGDWELVFDTDRPEFGGQGRIAPGQKYIPLTEKGRGLGIRVYLPARTAIALRRKKG